MGVAVYTVIRMRSKKKKIDLDELLRLRLEGNTVIKIAELLNVTTSTVSRYLKIIRNILYHTNPELLKKLKETERIIRRRRYKYPDIDKEVIEETLKNSPSIKEAARRLNIKPHVLYYYMETYYPDVLEKWRKGKLIKWGQNGQNGN